MKCWTKNCYEEEEAMDVKNYREKVSWVKLEIYYCLECKLFHLTRKK